MTKYAATSWRGLGWIVWAWAGLCAVVLADGATATADRVAVAQEIIPVKHRKGLLWKIEKSGVAPSYLLGTMHVDHPEVLALLEQAAAAPLRDASVVCTEVKLDFSAIAAELRNMFFADGRTLESVLGADLYKRTLAIAQRRGLPEGVIKNMKPFVAAYMLSMPIPKSEVLDERIYNQALRAGQEVCGLETPEEHGAVFDALPLKQQIFLLDQTVQHFDAIESSFDPMFKAYINRDLHALATLAVDFPWMDNQELAEFFVQRFVVDRNRIMVRRMQPWLAKGKAFFAIGALHLTGEVGALRLLEAQGYRVSAVY